MTGYVGPLDEQAVTNDDFRHVLFTGQHVQLVVMCPQPGRRSGRRCIRMLIRSSALSRARQGLC